MSKAFVVSFVKVAEFDSFLKNYITPTGAIMAKYGGKVIAASDQFINKEGEFPPGFGVLLEFPSMEQLEEFYADPDYQPLLEFRKNQGEAVLAFLPEGMAAMQP